MKTALERFSNSQGQLVQWPAKYSQQRELLAYLADKFKVGTTYREFDVNNVLKQWHTFQDWAVLRRALVDEGYLQRNSDGTEYRRIH